MTQTSWHEMSIEQLRTVVGLLDDDMLDILDARRRRSVTTSPYAGCSLLESLYRYTTRFPNGLELQTRRVITNHQRIQIAAAYMASLSPAERLQEEQGVLEDEDIEEDDDRNDSEDYVDISRRSDRLLMQRLNWRLGMRWEGVRWEVDAETFWAEPLPFEENMIRSANDPQFIRNQHPLHYYLFTTDRERDRFFMYYYNWAITGFNRIHEEENSDFLIWRYTRRRAMADYPRTAHVQFQRIREGVAPVNSVEERQLFHQWRPQNDRAMYEMRRRYSRRWRRIRDGSDFWFNDLFTRDDGTFDTPF